MDELTKIERETIITFNEEEDFAVVSTRMKRVMKELNKLNITPEKAFDDYEEYEIPIEWVKIRPNRKTTELQREKASERMKKINEKKNTFKYMMLAV